MICRRGTYFTNLEMIEYSETSLQWTPSGPQNSVRYREVSAT